jgi:hypothetical protein
LIINIEYNQKLLGGKFMKKSDITSLIVYALMLVALFLTFFFGVRDPISKSKVAEGFAVIGVALLVIVISFFVGSLILELGHVLGAKAGKYKILSFNFLGLTFIKLNGKTKFKLSSPNGLISECLSSYLLIDVHHLLRLLRTPFFFLLKGLVFGAKFHNFALSQGVSSFHATH